MLANRAPRSAPMAMRADEAPSAGRAGRLSSAGFPICPPPRMFLASGGNQSTVRTRGPVWPHVAFAVFCACAFLSLCWPVYPALGNRLAPRILGLPFSLAWIVGWIVASLIALVAYEWGVWRRAERAGARHED